LLDSWKDGAIAKIKELGTDVLVCDLECIPGLKVIDDLKIPMLINTPGGPYSMYQHFGVQVNPDLKVA